MAKKAAKPIAETTKATTAADAAARIADPGDGEHECDDRDREGDRAARGRSAAWTPGSMCGIANTARPSAARPKGMLIQNTHGQPQ